MGQDSLSLLVSIGGPVKNSLQAGPQQTSEFITAVQNSAETVKGTATVSSAAVGSLSGTLAAARLVEAWEKYLPSGPPGLSFYVRDVGRKYDGDKAPLVVNALYFSKALEGVAQVSAYGAKKYNALFNDQNWRKVENVKERYASALMRHLHAHLRGELLDPESDKPHIDMVAWNSLALSELEKK